MDIDKLLDAIRHFLKGQGLPGPKENLYSTYKSSFCQWELWSRGVWPNAYVHFECHLRREGKRFDECIFSTLNPRSATHPLPELDGAWPVLLEGIRKEFLGEDHRYWQPILDASAS
jgi:hypothetical protein